MAFTFNVTLSLGSGQTGLTLGAALMDTTGTIHATLRDLTTGFVEVGVGIYSWVSASIPDSYRGSVIFYVGTLGVASDFSGVVVKAGAAIAPEEFEDAALTLADTNELQADWADGGRLDLILDATALEATAQDILADTAVIGAAGAGLTEAGGTGDHLTALTLADGSITDATFTAPAESGPPTGVVGMLVWIAQRLGLRRVRKTSSAIEVYTSNGTTARTTNAYTTDGTTDDISAAGAP